MVRPRLSLKTRLFLGYAVLIAVSAALAVFGMAEMTKVGRQVVQMQDRAKVAHSMLAAERLVEAMRRAEIQYSNSFGQTGTGEITAGAASTRAQLAG